MNRKQITKNKVKTGYTENDWKKARKLMKNPPESWDWLKISNSVIQKYFMVLNQNEKRSKKV